MLAPYLGTVKGVRPLVGSLPMGSIVSRLGEVASPAGGAAKSGFPNWSLRMRRQRLAPSPMLNLPETSK